MEPEQPISNTKARSKRSNVAPVACEACRRRKSKCDGSRPCTPCHTRGAVCQYSAAEGETHGQATKRKYDELERKYDTLSELVRSVVSKNDHEASAILSRLRSGYGFDSVLRSLKDGELGLTDSVNARDESREELLVYLAQSTANLDELLSVTRAAAVNTNGVRKYELNALQNRINTVETILGTAKDVSTSPPPVTPTSPVSTASLDSSDRPRVVVPASTWTTLSSDQLFISQLVSVFLSYVNPYWRYVEEDLFLKDMRAGKPGMFCSSFLVNAMCAFACLHCDYIDAYELSRDPLTRGMKFHDEAMRLWITEIGSPSLTNIQALAILSLESGYRAKDKQTLSLISEALRLNQQLPQHETSPLETTYPGYNRARTNISWCLHHLDTACCTGWLTVSQPIDSRLGILPFLPDDDYSWFGKPYVNKTVTFRKNTLLREGCTLTRLKSSLNELLFSNKLPKSDSQLARDIKTMAERLETWYDNLPSDLRYDRNLPAPLYELHGEYHCAMMTLCAFMDDRKLTVGPVSRPDTPDSASSIQEALLAELDTKVCVHARRTALMLRDYREVYSLKVTLSFVFQAAAAGSNYLLRRLNTVTGQVRPVFLSEGTSLRDDIHAAFEECFRCLLGISTHMMMARGVLRLLTQTAINMDIELPESCIATFKALNPWRPTDVDKISSMYPNLAIARDAQSRLDAQMEDLLKQWERMSTEESNHAKPQVKRNDPV